MNLHKFLMMTGLLWICILSEAQNLQPFSDIRWAEYMSRQDMIWEKLPEHWYDAAFLGNGRLGLMIYKEPGKNYLRLETGNSDVHDHRTRRDIFGTSRLLTGHFALHPKGEIIKGEMRLDLWNAEASTHIITTQGAIHLQSVVHADEMVIMVKATTEGEEQDFQWEWIAAEANSPRYMRFKRRGETQRMPEDYPLNPLSTSKRLNQLSLSTQKLSAGGETVVGWKEEDISANERTLWINLTHSHPSEKAEKKCKNDINKACKKGYNAMLKIHRTWWNNFYQKSFVTLPDARTENFYWIQMYKLASATRGDRCLIDNAGPWLAETPWPNAWWNLNVQLTYWPLNSSNHTELAGSLENALYNHTEQLRLNVPAPYRHNSLGIGVASNFECITTEIGVPGKGRAQIGLLPWACHNLWLIYRHKMDDKILREKLYPTLKGAINYYLHFLKEGNDGKLHLPSTYSPEYGSAEDCNFDLALLRWGCETLLASAKRLNIKDPLEAQWRRVLQDLTPYPTDKNGLLIGKDTPYAFSHRHYSHLLAIYPLYLINKEQEGGTELIEKSLAFWQSKPKALLGYSCTGASSISATIGKGDDALKHLQKLFNGFLSSTTMYNESGPCIETPLSGAQCVLDMLLQSWGGKIRVFPAIPDSWKDVAFCRLLTEGAFEVSAKKENGKTQFIHIKSKAGEPCILTTDIANPTFKGAREVQVQKLANNTFLIDLKKGEDIYIFPQGETKRWTIKPVDNNQKNLFGLKLDQ